METDFKPIVGYKFRFTCSTITYCEVLEIIPNKLLSYTWKVKNETDVITLDSKVFWTLAEKDGGTELQLLHNGFTELEDYIGHNKAWIILGNQLVERLNTIKV